MNITQDLYNIQYGREKQETANGNRRATGSSSDANECTKGNSKERPDSKKKV